MYLILIKTSSANFGHIANHCTGLHIIIDKKNPNNSFVIFTQYHFSQHFDHLFLFYDPTVHTGITIAIWFCGFFFISVNVFLILI